MVIGPFQGFFDGDYNPGFRLAKANLLSLIAYDSDKKGQTW